MFIHDALLEAITCGVTEVEAKDLGARIRELRQVDSETGYTYLENEFCRLAKEENHPTAFKSASLNCNASKNRYANILPCKCRAFWIFAKYTIIFRRGEEAVKTEGTPRILKEGVTFFLME